MDEREEEDEPEVLPVDFPVALVLDFPVAVLELPAFALVPVVPDAEAVLLPEVLRLEPEAVLLPEPEEPEALGDLLPELLAEPLCAAPDIIEAEDASILLPG